MRQDAPTPRARLLGTFGRGLVDLLYPRSCPGCDGPAPATDPTGQSLPVCPTCESKLEPLVPPFCEVCGQPYESGSTEGGFRCFNCGGRKFAFDFAIAPYLASGLLRELVHRFKFGKVEPLRKPLGQLFARVFDDPRLSGHEWQLVPVPIHWRRRYQRGFNQAEELATVLSNITGYQVVDALQRVVFTPPQSRLNRQQRLDNLTRAIRVRPKQLQAIKDRDILLVDDIFTTGSTGQACAEVLKSAGARRVVVITLARG
ncbi:MAG: ComF family protein [Verrucomicrobiales bacterium]